MRFLENNHLSLLIQFIKIKLQVQWNRIIIFKVLNEEEI